MLKDEEQFVRLKSVGTNAQSTEDAPHDRQATIPNVPKLVFHSTSVVGRDVLKMLVQISRQLTYGAAEGIETDMQ